MKNFRNLTACIQLISILEKIKNEEVVRMEFEEYLLLTRHRPTNRAYSQLIEGD
jgi:hypothetical protein